MILWPPHWPEGNINTPVNQNNAESDKWLLLRGQDLSLFTWGCLFIVQCTVSSCHYFDLWGFPFSPIETSLIYNFIRSFNCKIKPQASRCGRFADAPKNWVKADRSPQARWEWPAIVGQRWQSAKVTTHNEHCPPRLFKSDDWKWH